jgi:hypothetical protein
MGCARKARLDRSSALYRMDACLIEDAQHEDCSMEDQCKQIAKGPVSELTECRMFPCKSKHHNNNTAWRRNT